MSVELTSQQNTQGIWKTLGLFLQQKGVFGRIVVPAIAAWIIFVIVVAGFTFGGVAPVIFSIMCVGAPGAFGILVLASIWWRGQFSKVMDLPHIFATSVTLRRGDDLDIDYRQLFKQNTEIVTLRVQLVLREWVRYTEGTSTYTDTRDIVMDEDWLDHEPVRPDQNYQHVFKLRVPNNAMHTFEVSNNKLTWHVKVDLDMPGWIDFKSVYSITVLPEVDNHADI